MAHYPDWATLDPALAETIAQSRVMEACRQLLQAPRLTEFAAENGGLAETIWSTFTGPTGDVIDITMVPGATLSARIQAAILLLPATGGTIDCRSLQGVQALGADLPISASGVKILWGRVTVTMTTYRILIASTAQGFSMEGISPWGSNLVFGGGSTGRGTSFVYTGSGNPFEIGSTTGSTLLRWLQFKNFTLHMTGAADSADVVGMWFRRVLFADCPNVTVLGSVTSDNQTLIRLDGTGSYTSFVRFTNPSLNGGGVGVHLTGDGIAAANACQFTGGNYAGNNNGNSIGFLGDADSNGNRIDGLDVENCAIAYKLEGTNSGWYVEGRIEGNTEDVNLGASTVGNWIKFSHGTIAPTLTDAGTGNTVHGTAGNLLYGLPIQAPSFRVAGKKVIGAQGAAVADVVLTADTGTLPTAGDSLELVDADNPTPAELLQLIVSEKAKNDALRARLRAHGLIDT